MTVASDGYAPEEPLRILLLEDNPGDAGLFEERLTESDLEADLIWEEGLEEGLKRLTEAGPDVLVLDLGLPDSKGVQTVRRCREAAPSVPVVVLTGGEGEELARQVQEAGATEYLQKGELMPALLARTLRWAVRTKAMEERLGRQRAWIESIAENVTGGLFRTAPEEGIQYANEALASTFGYEDAGALRTADPETLYAEPGRRDELLGRLAEEGTLENEEVRLRRADGSIFVGLLNAQVVRGGSGEIQYVDGVITDITERKQRERELAESEARYRTLAESARDAILTIDADSTIQYANPAVEEVFGYAPEELVGEPLTMLMPKRHREAHQTALDRFVETGEPTMSWTAVEFPGLRKSGDEIALSISFSAFEEEGEMRFQGIIRDVTEREEREEALREQEAQFRGLANSIPGIAYQFVARPDPPVHWEHPYGFRFVSDRAEEILGLSPDPADFFERALPQVPHSHRQELLDSIDEAVEEESVWRFEFPFERPDGERIWLLGTSAPQRRGEEVVYNGVFLDITERREAERALQEERNRYATLFESLPTPVVEYEPRGDGAFVKRLNPAFEDTFGTEASALEGEDLDDFFVPEEEVEEAAALDRRALREGPQHAEVRREAAGEVRDFRVDVAGREQEEGPPEAYAIYTDITDRKRREREIRKQEEKTEGLYAATEKLVSAESRQEVAERLQALLGETFDYPLSAVHLVEEETLSLAAVSSEIPGQMPEVPVPDVDSPSLSARVYRQGETIIAQDLSEVDTDIDYGELRSGACVPLGDHGVLSAASTEKEAVDPFDVQLLEILGTHASTVLDRIDREASLQEERDLLGRILETSPVAIAVFNTEGEFTQASGRAEEILGLERDEVTDRTYNDPKWGITAPDGSPMPDEELPFARVMATGEPVYDVEHAIEWPDGRRRLLSVSGAPLRDEDGDVEGAVFHIDDITERRKTERALRESEERFRKMFENAAIGIAIVDEEGVVVEGNPVLHSMMGYREEELHGRHFSEVTHPDDLGEDRALFEELMEGARDRYQIEKRYVRRGGEVFWGRLTVSRHTEDAAVGMIEDIDDQKRYQENLRAAKEEAERLNRLKSAFLANMSHEIRTPLTSIIGFAEAIGEAADPEAEGTVAEFSRLIEKSGRRLMDTLTGVLNLSKLEAGEMTLSAEEVDLVAAAEESAEQFRPQAEDAGLALHVRTGDGPVWARANESGLQVVLRNLLSNAIKYNEEGGDIRVRTYREPESAVLEVEDTGIGMEPEEVETLFDAFAQESEGRARQYEGTGLGLAITKKATEEMGGSIEVETEKGQGSRFTVRLPRAHGPAA